MANVVLNGETREIPDGLSVTSLIQWIEAPADRVAVELNLEIVPRKRWDEIRIKPGDRLEIVHFVGGG